MLNDKTAVITGASRGIGREIALEFAKLGANLAIIDLKVDETATVESAEALGVKSKAYECNVVDFVQSKEVCGQIAKDFGSVDILVNNAGITKDGLILMMSESDFDDVINVNLKGAFNFTKHMARYLMKSKAGRIINISSVIGIAGNIGQANYSASKAGLIGLTKSTAREFAGKNITCNAIAPGFIETDMTASLPEEIVANMKNNIPLKRMGSAADVASLAAFLASDSASYITGEVIKVDGGMCI